MTNEEMKIAAAKAAIEYIEPGMIVGVGTGSTTNHFINFLAEIKYDIEGAVASSIATESLLKSHGIDTIPLNNAGQLSVYVDGADESDKHLNLIKGGGGALTREKVIASASNKFICIADETKLVNVMGRFPLPIEVIPMAQSFVAREIVKMGGIPLLRDGFKTDNGNIIIDVKGLKISEPAKLENSLNNIAGIVTVGLFAKRSADILILGTQNGVDKLS